MQGEPGGRRDVAGLRAAGAAPSAAGDASTPPAAGFPMIPASSVTGREEDARHFVKFTCGNVIIRESGENH